MSEQVYGGARPESRIGDYAVLGHWASGAVSHIYVARRTGDTEADRLYALKVPRTAHAIYAANHGVFLLGADEGPRARHPHTVSTREVLDRNGRLYMVTDFVNGERLAQALSARPGERWPVSLALLVGLHLARALEFVHGSQPDGEVRPHTEVNPMNVLLGYDGRARLLDSAIIGTERRLELVRHMAPEQAAELPDLDARVDVYGVGLVVWEMLVGRPALVGRNETEVKAAALEGRIDAPSAHGAPTSPSTDEVVMRALCVEPDQRYPTAQELAEALEAELSRVAPERDLEADLRDVLHRIFPRGASRLSRALARWAEPPDRQLLERPGGPMAAIRDALEARRSAEDRSFADLDAALEDLAQSLPPVAAPAPPPPETLTQPLRASSRRGLLVGVIAAVGLAAAAIAAFAPRGEPAKGSLRVVTEPPEAEVLVDGRSMGRTPVTLSGLDVGRAHDVLIRKSGYIEVTRSVTFTEGGTRGWDLELQPLAPAAPEDPDSFKDNPY